MLFAGFQVNYLNKRFKFVPKVIVKVWEKAQK